MMSKEYKLILHRTFKATKSMWMFCLVEKLNKTCICPLSWLFLLKILLPHYFSSLVLSHCYLYRNWNIIQNRFKWIPADVRFCGPSELIDPHTCHTFDFTVIFSYVLNNTNVILAIIRNYYMLLYEGGRSSNGCGNVSVSSWIDL